MVTFYDRVILYLQNKPKNRQKYSLQAEKTSLKVYRLVSQPVFKNVLRWRALYIAIKNWNDLILKKGPGQIYIHFFIISIMHTWNIDSQTKYFRPVNT